jgi:tetratricopeptide (TPR) repeat protein
VIDALNDHFENSSETIIWFDLFSYNQHLSFDHPVEWWNGALKSSIVDMNHLVLVLAPWHSCPPLQRAWCLYELFCCGESSCKFDVAMTKFQRSELLKAIEVNTDQEIKKLLGYIDVSNSEATNLRDKERIMEAIRASVDVEIVNTIVFKQLRHWMRHLAKEPNSTHSVRSYDPHLLAGSSNQDEDVTERVITLVETELTLGSIYVSQGKLPEAEKVFVDCLQLAKKELGHDHFSTNSARNSLAVLFEAQGKYDEAEDLLLLVLKLNQLAQQTFNEKQLRLQGERGNDYHHHIDLSKPVEKEEEEALEKSYRLRDERLATMSNLASVYMAEQKLDLAVEIYESCYRERRASLEPEGNTNDETAASVFVAVESRRNSPRANQKEEDVIPSASATAGGAIVNEESTAITEKSRKINPVQGLTSSSSQLNGSKRQRYHEELFSIMNNLATVWEKLQEFQNAESMLLECIQMQRKVLGDAHADTLMTEANLAGIYFSQNKYLEAEPLLISVLDKRKVVLGEEHPLTVATMQSLAMTYFSQGQYAEAEDLLIPCLEIRKSLLGDSHPHTIDTMSTLAMVFNQQDKVDEAEVFFVLSYETQRRVLGESHPDTLEYMSNLAVFYYNIGEKQRSESLARECWLLCVDNLGVNHPITESLLETFPYLKEED